jgi:hypothetical protein
MTSVAGGDAVVDEDDPPGVAVTDASDSPNVAEGVGVRKAATEGTIVSVIGVGAFVVLGSADSPPTGGGASWTRPCP